MELKKLIGAVAVLSLLLAIPQVAAQENRENIQENYATQEQLQSVIAAQERLENAVQSLKESIRSLKTGFENLSGTVQELPRKAPGEEKAEGGTITVVALTEDGIKPLNFGGMFGGSSPMTMWMMTQQQEKGILSIPTVEGITPVMLMGEGGLVEDATVEAYTASENGFAPVSLQVSGGMTVIPPVGKFISGTVSAPNYDDTTFYVRVGKAKKKKKPKAGKVEIKSTPKVLRPGEGAVVKAVRNGKIIKNVSLSILGREHPNPAQITVPKNQPSLYVEVLKNGKTVASEPLSIKKASAGGAAAGGGWSIPWKWITIFALVGLVAWKYRYRIPFVSSRRVT